MGGRFSSFWFDYLLLGLLAFLWGSSYLLIKVAVEEIPPFTLIAGRVSIAAVFLSCILLIRRERLPNNLNTWWHLLIQACFTSILAWTILAWGQQRIDSGLASGNQSLELSSLVLLLLAVFLVFGPGKWSLDYKRFSKSGASA